MESISSNKQTPQPERNNHSIWRRLITIMLLSICFVILGLFIASRILHKENPCSYSYDCEQGNGNQITSYKELYIQHQKALSARNEVTKVDFSGHLSINESDAPELKSMIQGFHQTESNLPATMKLTGGDNGSVVSGHVSTLETMQAPSSSRGKSHLN